MIIKKCAAIILAILLIQQCFAQNIKVAVAANLQSVIKVLGADFTKRSGIVIEPIIGSSGNLATQIKNGAPFDVFLSADMAFPQGLYTDGFAVDKPLVYASGSLIVCSTQNIDIKHWQSIILNNDISKIAIANPAIAPYGKAATEALTKLNIIDKIKAKTVTGESIAQVNTYIITGVVNFGFTSQSLLMDDNQTIKLYWAPVDKKLYTPIQQGMVILKHATDNNLPQVQKFCKYLLSSSAKAILKKYGYLVQ
ncbi:molybdate ABC transporter substrate-binding protein [Mucilaginibacter sp. HMF5004]|uniref:molybdate ABC transporter substrate-binding protein n=1 Tax=Mucilaginibacter rivuli TaxID=2857527 RepID=UPI001C5E5198|nr:molybdate ABC transporter substrate-binding protein [Mucilaginibacter rivuli]MBW4889412.1 molybdate ABC transporter substrate-binding protein [Mucilaginibacter rivuli]